MSALRKRSSVLPVVFSLVTFVLASPPAVRAHCDTMSGPVVADGRRALESGGIAPVQKWVPAADEAELRAALDAALGIRGLNAASRELADRYFLETLVRIHRAGEGAPFTGLKPAADTPPAIAAADQALVTGSVDDLARDVSAAVAAAVQKRFERARELKVHAEESPEAGRRYVAAYVEYVHFVEKVSGLASPATTPHEGGAAHEHTH